LIRERLDLPLSFRHSGLAAHGGSTISQSTGLSPPATFAGLSVAGSVAIGLGTMADVTSLKAERD
jgi:hypothetical protein